MYKTNIMKTNTILLIIISFLIVSTTCIGQEERDGLNISKAIHNTINSDKSSTVIWSEDFQGGFPSGWATYSSNTGSGNNGSSYPGNTAECPWKHSIQGSWGYWNSVGTNSAGNPTAAAAAINSTTANNGFLISDIDSANHWNGNPGSNSGSTYHYIDSYFITDAINTTGFLNVNLEFEHTFRFNNSVDLIVSVSNDSISWTDFYVQGNTANNSQSADPEYLSLNISSVAGNQATVYIKVGWTARVYFWMIDDMKIVETPKHKLDLVEANYGGWFTTPVSTGFGLDYTLYPLSQAIAQPYKIEGVVANVGSEDQTAQLNVNITNSSNSVVYSNTPSNNLVFSSDTTILVDSLFTPTVEGLYNFSVWASSDSAITDTINLQSTVTDTVYGRDNGSQESWYGLGRSCGGMVIGTYYDLFAADPISSISVYIDDQSVVGSDIYVALYEIDFNNDKILLDQSIDYTLQAGDIGNWVTVQFDNLINVVPGTYMAAVGGYAHPLDTSTVAMSNITRPTTCYIQKNGCLNSGQTFGSWYWLSRVPMIRLNFGLISSVNTHDLNSNLVLYPNPVEDQLTFRLSFLSSGYYNIDVIDLYGRKLISQNVYLDRSSYRDINVSSLSPGLYILNISNEDKVVNRRFVKE